MDCFPVVCSTHRPKSPGPRLKIEIPLYPQVIMFCNVTPSAQMVTVKNSITGRSFAGSYSKILTWLLVVETAAGVVGLLALSPFDSSVSLHLRAGGTIIIIITEGPSCPGACSRKQVFWIICLALVSEVQSNLKHLEQDLEQDLIQPVNSPQLHYPDNLVKLCVTTHLRSVYRLMLVWQSAVERKNKTWWDWLTLLFLVPHNRH